MVKIELYSSRPVNVRQTVNKASSIANHYFNIVCYMLISIRLSEIKFRYSVIFVSVTSCLRMFVIFCRGSLLQYEAKIIFWLVL